MLLIGMSLCLNSCVQEPEGVIRSCAPPDIIETVTKNGSTDFHVDDTIIFVFEEPIDTSTVDTTTVFVIETTTGDTIHGDVFPQPCVDLGKRGFSLVHSSPTARLAKTSPLHDQPHPTPPRSMPIRMIKSMTCLMKSSMLKRMRKITLRKPTDPPTPTTWVTTATPPRVKVGFRPKNKMPTPALQSRPKVTVATPPTMP